MAIIYDASASGNFSSGTTITFSHTVGAGNFRMLVVGVNISAHLAQPTTTGVTFNGVALTKVTSKQLSASSGRYLESSVWILPNPDLGTHSVVATINWNGADTTMGTTGSSSYFGCKQTTTADASATTSGTSTGAKTLAVTTIANNCWVYCTEEVRGDGVTLAHGQTERYNAGGDKAGSEDTNAPKTPAGTQNMTFTVGATALNGYTAVAISFAPTVPNVKTINGLAFASIKTINGLVIENVKSINSLSVLQ